MNEVLKNNGSSMYILNDKPLEAFKKICKQFNVKQVLTNHDYEPYAIERDEDIRIFLAGQGIPFTTYKDQVIFEKSEVVKADGTPYTVFPPYSKVWRRKYSEQKPESFPSEDMLLNMVKTKPFHFPSLKDIGFEHVEMPGFDTSINEETILRYHETRNLPGIAGTSHISVHLRFRNSECSSSYWARCPPKRELADRINVAGVFYDDPVSFSACGDEGF
jgi:deoxyribodipyrimidine photo-lyase